MSKKQKQKQKSSYFFGQLILNKNPIKEVVRNMGEKKLSLIKQYIFRNV